MKFTSLHVKFAAEVCDFHPQYMQNLSQNSLLAHSSVYSGMVEGCSAAGEWSILADNCSCAPVVSRRDVSRCKSRKGDQMLINRDKCATVTKVFVTSRLVRVEVEKREELGFIRRKMAEVHVPKHAVLAGWRDRMVYTPSIVPALSKGKSADIAISH
jgi:hypothetical protein